MGLYLAEAVAEVAKADFAITGKCTRLKLHDDVGFNSSRSVAPPPVVSEWLDLPLAPLGEPLPGGTSVIPLKGSYPGPSPASCSRYGKLADGVDAPVAEHAEIAAVEHPMMPGGRTTLTSPSATHDFDRGALRINANVAAATHGETRFEILGSGGAAGAYPTFAAKQGPLTFVSAEVPGGVGPELIVRVNGIAWKEAPDLLGAGPSDRLYIAPARRDRQAADRSGDGFAGALLPAGQDNITIDFRTGIGLGGGRAGQLNILMSRPRSRRGDQSAGERRRRRSGRDRRAARRVAVLCCTLDRVVSLTDFADFALTLQRRGRAPSGSRSPACLHRAWR